MSVYEIVNNIITDKLREGVVPWKKLWKSKQGLPALSLTTGKGYSGINQILLSCVAIEYEESPFFLTYKQAEARGGYVKEGEKGFPVVFFKMVEPKDSESKSDDDNKKKSYFVLRYYKVFNLEQCENISLTTKEQMLLNSRLLELKEFTPIERAEALLRNYSEMPDVKIDTSYNPMYLPAFDTIKLPPKGQFETVEEFYSSWFHELVHSTGHESRLNRLGNYGKGMEFKSVEELTAEIGSAYLSYDAGIISNVVDNNSAYIDYWLKQIEGNSRLFTSATSKAEKAYKFISDHSVESSGTVRTAS